MVQVLDIDETLSWTVAFFFFITLKPRVE